MALSQSRTVTPVTGPTLEVLEPNLGAELGDYRLIEKIGEGGMAWVYAAEHRRIGRRVALKVLQPHLATNMEAVSRFFAEARAVNQLKHPGIVEVTDFFDDGDLPFLVMELLRGEDLAARLRTGAMPIDEVVRIGAEIADALFAVHQAGIVHRDLKPHNVFLLEDGAVKIMDFGVAKLLGDGIVQTNLRTTAGAILGTPEYMSPEQAAGRVADARADIYSLGIVLYEMATGRRPFVADDFGGYVLQHMTAHAAPPTRLRSEVPARLSQTILACLEKDPEHRPQTMSELAGVLRGAELARRRRAPMLRRVAFAAASVALGVGAVVLVSQLAREPVQPEPVVVVAAPAEVRLTMRTSPSGARVTAKGELLGVTPFESLMPAQDADVTVEIALAGHLTTTHQLRLHNDLDVEIALVEVPGPVEPIVTKRTTKKPTPVKKLERRNVLDPFDP